MDFKLLWERYVLSPLRGLKGVREMKVGEESRIESPERAKFNSPVPQRRVASQYLD
ncbi:MAG: hypothetical protein AB1631_34565 [Acidobacteriota bacterium]